MNESHMIADAAVMAYRARAVLPGTPIPFDAIGRSWTAYPDKTGNLLVMDENAAVELIIKNTNAPPEGEAPCGVKCL